MRPIDNDKGGQGNYPWGLDSDLSTKTWDFSRGGGAQAANRLFGTVYPTYQQCLETWVTVAQRSNEQIKMPKNLPRMKTVVESVKKSRIGPIYRQAGKPLLDQTGAFCYYCEMYLPDKVEVEHVTPKAQYPMFCLAWENFNLSCGPCNGKAAKSDNPTRATVVDDFLDGKQPNEEIDYYDEIRSRYEWPDDHPGAFVDLTPRLEYLSTATATAGQWLPVDDTLSVKLDMRADPADITKREVFADVYLDATTKVRRQVRVTIQGRYKISDRMIDLVKLNKAGDENSTISDRRLIQRTETWFKILELLTLAQAQPTGNFDLMWSVVLSTAKSAGFYSVWVRILKLLDWTDPGNTTQLLARRFALDSNAQAYYPGTDTRRVPGP